MDAQNESPIKAAVFLIIIIALFCANLPDDNRKSIESSTSKMTSEQKQERMSVTNDLISQMKNEGFLKKIERGYMTDDEYINIFWVNESMWHAMDFETKELSLELFKEYSELRTSKKACRVKGNQSGKDLVSAMGVK